MDWDAWLRQLAVDPLQVVLCNQQRVGADYALDWRRLDEHLLYGLQDGACQIDCGGGWRTCQAPLVFWLPPRACHRLRLAPGRRRMRLVHVRWTGPRAGCPGGLRLLQGAAAPLDDLARAHAAEREGGPLWRRRFAAALVGVHARLLAAELAPAAAGLSPAQRKAIDELLERRGPAGLDAAAIATRLGLSHDHLTRLFRQSHGMPPRRWLARERVRLAAVDLLDGDRTIAAIAEAHGYADAASFSHAFRKFHGTSPRAYRLRRRGSG